MSTTHHLDVAFAFTGQFLTDLNAGRTRTLTEYLEQYPDHSDTVTERYHELTFKGTFSKSAAETSTPPWADQFELIKKLGQGAQGSVWLAEDLRLQRRVAIKVLEHDSIRDQDRVRRYFRQEVLALARVTHPNVVRLYDARLNVHQLFLICEYVEGPTLRDVIKSTGPLPVQRALSLLEGICRGLDAAHRAHVIHCDLKPANLLIAVGPDGEETVKIADFGLAVLDGYDADLVGTAALRCGVGTLLYMSPEQVVGKRLDSRTDLYSLGAILYEMLTGTPPLTAPDFLQMLEEITSTIPESPRARNKKIPATLAKAIMICLDKDPARRFATAMNLFNAASRQPSSLEQLKAWWNKP